MSQPNANDLYSQLDEESRKFYEFHGVQLISINFPPKADLITKLYNKLKEQIFDAGNFFQIIDNEDKNCYQVIAQGDLDGHGDVYLIDHAFSFRYTQLRKHLEGNPGLQERLRNMMKHCNKKHEHPNFPKKKKVYEGLKEFDDQEIDDPNELGLMDEVVVLSLWGNNISDIERLRVFLEKQTKLKAIWLNGNPVASKENKEALFDFIEANFPNIELLNSQFTKHVAEWGLKFATLYPKIHKIDKTDLGALTSLDLSDRGLFRMKNIDIFSSLKSLRTVDLRGHTFQDLSETNKLISIFQKIPRLEHVYVDQQLEEILWSLHENKKLESVCPDLLSINSYYLSEGRPKPEDEEIKYIFTNIWKLAGSYRLASTEKLDETSIWYIMDEFGSAIQHSDTPNSWTAPFLFAPNNKLDASTISYNVLWLNKGVKANEEITRDYLSGITEEKFRTTRLNVWFDLPKRRFIEKNQLKMENLKKNERSGEEILEIIEKNVNRNIEKREANKKKGADNCPWTIATDSAQVSTYLTDPNFVLTKNIDEAKILWITENLKEELQTYADRYLNQFPYESCLISKTNLADTLYRTYGLSRVIQKTYLLDRELDAFVGEFLSRQKAGLPNYWIMKPPNMTRSMDMVVTNNLDLILRNLETGPKLAQKYIERPFTYNKKKVDFRFNCLVRSIDPLDILLYKMFFVRSSYNQFNLDPRSMTTYETHFTVMNYLGDPNKITKIYYKDFIAKFDEDHKVKNITWESTYEKIKQIVREAFIAARLMYPQMHNEKVRAIYGIDLMFDEDLNPYILEITFQPDNARVCQLYPFIYNDIFRCLYLYNDEDTNVDRLF